MRAISMFVVFALICLRCSKSKRGWTWYENGVLKSEETNQLGPLYPSTVPKNTTAVFMREIPEMELISGLENLSTVTVVQSNITILPRMILNVPNLRSIKLLRNSKLYIESGSFQGLNVIELEISRNFMTSLEDGAFLYLHSLQNVKLDRNSLKEWNPNAFLKTYAVKLLNLNGNDIKYLPADSFRNLKYLKTLLLSANLIETIHEDAFRGLNDLDELNLSENNLVSLPENLFAPQGDAIFQGKQTFTKKKFAKLYLNKNHLSFLTDKIMYDLSETKEITMLQNPWKCACFFKISKWAHSHNIKTDETFTIGPLCVAAQQICVEKINCDLINDFYLRYPQSQRMTLYLKEQRYVKYNENFFQHLNTFCNLSMTSQ